MNSLLQKAVLLATAALAAGCADQTIGTTRSLGVVQYDAAFDAALATMSQRYPIAGSDRASGTIVAQPKVIQASADRLLGGADASRQLARLDLRRQDGQVVAHAVVELQRQRAETYKRLRLLQDNYDTVPNKTPAQREAATTIEQNESWETQRYLHDVEADILAELYERLHRQAADAQGETTPTPTSQSR